jgi:hypothetical protein
MMVSLTAKTDYTIARGTFSIADCLIRHEKNREGA